MAIFIPPRKSGAEFLDDPATPLEDLSSALADMARANRVLAYDTLVILVTLLTLRRFPRRILDVGTALADIPVAFSRWGRRSGLSVTAIGIDLNPRTTELARARVAGEPGVSVHCMDLFDLPQDWEKFDLVTCHKTLHHLPTDRLPAFLSRMNEAVAPGGALVVGDLERGIGHEWAAWAFLKAIWAQDVTVHDGVISVQNSLTAGEGLELARQGGVRYLRRIPLAPPGHFLLAGRKDAS